MFKKLFRIPYWYLIAIPLLCIGLGAASNQAVLVANGDKFPVSINAEKQSKMCAPQDSLSQAIAAALAGNAKTAKLEASTDINLCANGGEFLDDTHVIMTAKSHLTILADIFDFHDGIYSVGDGLLMLGEWSWDISVIAWFALVIRKFIEG